MNDAAESWDGHSQTGPDHVAGWEMVRVWFRDGSSRTAPKNEFWWGSSVDVPGTSSTGDIVAYEVIEQPTTAGDTHEMLTFAPLADVANNTGGGAGKQTNPKDLVGSRKVPLSTLPFRVLWRVGLAMLEGMCKYGRHNYRVAGVRASVYFDGAMRHLGAWWEGEDIDPDSGFNHIDKLLADLMVLRDSMLAGNWVDDRPPRAKDDFTHLNAEAARIVDMHKDKTPLHFTIVDTEAAA